MKTNPMALAMVLAGFCSIVPFSHAQMYEGSFAVGPKPIPTETKDGVTTIQVNKGYKIEAPEGLKVENSSGQIILQDPIHMTLEKLRTLEERLSHLEKNQEEMRKDLLIIEEVASNSGKIYNYLALLKRRQDEFIREIAEIQDLFNEIKTNPSGADH